MTPGGAMVMAVFAAIWWAVGAHASGRATAANYALAVAITIGVIAMAMLVQRRGGTLTPGEHARRARMVGIASGIEGLAILVAVNVLANLGRMDLAVSAIAVIVGLHFIPLARWLPARAYYATSMLLIVTGVAGARIADTSQRVLIVSTIAALVLWGTAVAALVASLPRRLRA